MANSRLQEKVKIGKLTPHEARDVIKRWRETPPIYRDVLDPLETLQDIRAKVSFLDLSLCHMEGVELHRGLNLLLFGIEKEIGAVAENLEETRKTRSETLENILGRVRHSLISGSGHGRDASEDILALLKKRDEIDAQIDEACEVAETMNLRHERRRREGAPEGGDELQ